MSTEPPNRTLSGVSLPQWMKSKISDSSYDLEAFSPPTHEDGFLLMRYSKSRSRSPEKKAPEAHPEYQPISEALAQSSVAVLPPRAQHSGGLRHTESCQDFIPQAKFSAREIGLRHVSSEVLDKVKSSGTDDGFKGESAACGYSVLAVAQTMVSSGAVGGKGKYDIALPASHRMRRNSKSLPSSPLSSPKLFRKNPFFTDPLFGSSEIGKMGTEVQRRPIEDVPVVRARPSHLREMNFWSPTSM